MNFELQSFEMNSSIHLFDNHSRSHDNNLQPDDNERMTQPANAKKHRINFKTIMVGRVL